MKKIALHDHETNNYPNLVLMKLSAFHKSQNHSIYWFNSFETYDTIYSSKVFTWTPQNPYLPHNTTIGGTGYDMTITLPNNIEHICPDYTLYNCQSSYGFLTRGCPRICPHCFVPKKEGDIKPHADYQEFANHKHIVLMDNNVLAHQHGIHQIEEIAKTNHTIDFNQGLDARLIDNSIAKLLSKIKWKPTIRLACDSTSMMKPIHKAVELLRWHNATPRNYFVYVLIKNTDSALERIKFLKGLNLDPFAQPYRNENGDEPPKIAKQLARWTNHKAIFKSVPWKKYQA